MISEDTQDRAIEYVFGELSPQQQRAFENELQSQPELQIFVGEMRESLGILAQDVQDIAPPAHLKARIMALTHGRDDLVPVAKMHIPVRGGARASVARIASTMVLLLLALVAGFEVWNNHAQSGVQNAKIASLTQQLALLRGNLEAQRQQIVSLAAENSLLQMRVVTLSPKVAPFANANAIVIWNARQQQGLIKGDHIFGPGNGKDYQLWIIDPSLSAPVSAGIIAVGADGTFTATFKPIHPVSSVTQFAISIEASGGSTIPRGPIVLMGG